MIQFVHMLDEFIPFSPWNEERGPHTATLKGHGESAKLSEYLVISGKPGKE